MQNFVKFFLILLGKDMSKSYKKEPFHGISVCKSKVLKRAKVEMTRSSRKRLTEEDDILSGSYYKKIDHSWRWGVDEGKHYAPNWEKAYRK